MVSDSKLFTSFQTHLLTEKRCSQNTFLAYQRDIEQLIAFLAQSKVSLAGADKTDLKKYLAFLKRKGLKARTLSRKISALKLFYGYAEERFDTQNPALALQFPKLEKTLPIYLTQNEVEQLFTVANGDKSMRGVRNKVMLSLLYASGMRVSEMLATRLDQINFQTGFMHLVGKGNKERSVPLPNSVLELLKQYVNDVQPHLLAKARGTTQNLLFFSVVKGQVRPMTRQSFWALLKKLITQCGIKKNISPHSLRHSLATHLLRNGANLRTLQMLLGHQNVSTVQIYTHLEKSQLRNIYDDKHPRS